MIYYPKSTRWDPKYRNWLVLQSRPLSLFSEIQPWRSKPILKIKGKIENGSFCLHGKSSVLNSAWSLRVIRSNIWSSIRILSLLWLPSKARFKISYPVLLPALIRQPFNRLKNWRWLLLCIWANDMFRNAGNLEKLQNYINSGGDSKWRFACGDSWAKKVNTLQTNYIPYTKGTPVKEICMWSLPLLWIFWHFLIDTLAGLSGGVGTELSFDYTWYDQGGPTMNPEPPRNPNESEADKTERWKI